MNAQCKVAAAALALALVSGAGTGAAQAAHPRQPYMGFSGHVVRVHSFGPAGHRMYGMHVDSVEWGTPAWRMGLERGDVVLTVDCVAFRSRAGYLQSLRLAGQRPSVLVLNVRTGRPVRCSCRLPHVQEQGRPHEPDAYYLAVD